MGVVLCLFDLNQIRCERRACVREAYRARKVRAIEFGEATNRMLPLLRCCRLSVAAFVVHVGYVFLSPFLICATCCVFEQTYDWTTNLLRSIVSWTTVCEFSFFSLPYPSAPCCCSRHNQNGTVLRDDMCRNRLLRDPVRTRGMCVCVFVATRAFIFQL